MGLIPMNPEYYQSLAREMFLTPEFPKVTSEVLDDVISEISTDRRKDRVYFGLDNDFLVGHCGHYLINGSEYIGGIAAGLGRRLGLDFSFKLREIGIPTIFVCDIPLHMIKGSVLRSLAGRLLTEIFEIYIGRRQGPVLLSFGFEITERLPPDFIVSHYHPGEIPDPGRCRALYRPPMAECNMCRRYPQPSLKG